MDTGRAGAIGSRSHDSFFDLSYFAKIGRLPKKKIIAYMHDDIPAPDFTNMGGGSISRVNNRMRVVCGIPPNNFGWDLGAAYTKILMISMLGKQSTDSTGIGIFISHTQPGSEIVDGFHATSSAHYAQMSVDRFAASSVAASPIQESYLIGTPESLVGGPNVASALFIDVGANEMVLFCRVGGSEWIQVNAPVSCSAGPADFRYVGYRPNQVSSVAVWLGQFGVWAG